MNPACFPTPYPGESLYSILCRYHVRSCNKNDIYTIAQLFGFRTSIRYTVLSPALLAYETGWLKELSGITMESLMNENTAFRFSLPCADNFGPGKLSTENNTSEKSCIFRRIHRKNIHPSKRLRYCPKCAAEQKRVFGEAYWGVLPQMAGYEVCHIHGEPIRESIIPLNAIQYKFYPASCVLSSSSPEIYEGMDKMNKINRYYTSYQRHASEINWCYCNGHRIGRYIDKIYDYARKNIPGATIDYNQMAADEMVDYPSPYYSYYSSSAQWFLFPFFSHIQLIRMFELISGTVSSALEMQSGSLL